MTFMKDAARAARLMRPHIEQLENGVTVYDRAQALFSIVEQCCLALDKAAFWKLYAAHCAGDRSGFDELLNEVLSV